MSGAPALLDRSVAGCDGPDCLDRIHDLLEEVGAGIADLDDGDRTRFETAVIEILGNILGHSVPSAAPFDCLVRIRVFPDQLLAELTDTAQEVTVSIDDASLPEDFAEHGRGLAMARAAVDELSYRRADGQNHWRISKRRVAATGGERT